MSDLHLNSIDYSPFIESLLNIFFREMEIPIDSIAIPIESLPITSSEVMAVCFRFPRCGSALIAGISHRSSSGYHRYSMVWHQHTYSYESISPVELLLKSVLLHVYMRAKDDVDLEDRIADLMALTKNSITNMNHYLTAPKPEREEASLYIEREQNLKIGHPFHLFAKSNKGFSLDDKAKYAPELSTRFQLVYFALDKSLVKHVGLNKLPHASAGFAPIAKLLGPTRDDYVLVPVHPWQANLLRLQDGFSDYLESQKIIDLGEQGEWVFPTSSVRTVWLPKSDIHIKLPLSIRITNFIRNNPESHVLRAVSASDYIHRYVGASHFDTLSIMLDLNGSIITPPELTEHLSVMYRYSTANITIDKTELLGALVEHSNHSSIPLSEKINEAAHYSGVKVSEKFILSWWERYSEVVLLSTLTLFSETGVSLEAHLQNSLMQFDFGFPLKLIVRDMEGVSIDETMVPSDVASQYASSGLLYSQHTAWHRFLYYVVVNHFSHVLTMLARSFSLPEDLFWKKTLDALIASPLPLKVLPWLCDLLIRPTLPAKANLISLIHKQGECPSWVPIDNPLYLNQSSTAQNRVIIQLLESLLFEGILTAHSHDKTICFEGDNGRVYTLNPILGNAFDRPRLTLEGITLCERGTIKPVQLGLLLLDLSAFFPQNLSTWKHCAHELIHTFVKHAQTIDAPNDIRLREMAYNEQESRINNGHLYHPCFKSRLGFSLLDHTRYCPELASPFPLILLSIDPNAVNVFHGKSFDPDLTTCTDVSNERLLLPVHPWQWEHWLKPRCKQALASGTLLHVPSDDIYRPQQSIRTLSHASKNSAYNIKLPMNVLNTSTTRTLASHTLENAPLISDWLSIVYENLNLHSDYKKPILLREVASAEVDNSVLDEPLPGSFAVIYRESVLSKLDRHQSALPMTALTQLDNDSLPLINAWVDKFSIKSYLNALFNHVYIPILHCLFSEGIAFESHGQNMVLIHEEGLPTGIALKDFHDGIRFFKPWLSNPELLPNLTDAPLLHRQINVNSYLEAKDLEDLKSFLLDALLFVNLSEISWFFKCHFSYDEKSFWRLLKASILDYQTKHPHLSERFNELNLFSDSLVVEKLASRRCFNDDKLRMHDVTNPLSNEWLSSC